MSIKIVCPSKGRANNVRTTQLIPSLTLIVPAGEVEDYKAHNPNTEVVGVPSHIRGITHTRQWILDNWASEDVFMIDDDVVSVRKNYFYGEGSGSIDDPETILEIINQTAFISKQINSRVFSFSKIRNPLEYNAFSPIVHTGYMNASFCGFIRGHGLAYDLNLSEGEDHYISCLTIYMHRYCLIDNRYSFVTDGNFTALGGCNDYRTRESMIRNTLYLRQKFGEAIQYKEPTALKQNVNIGERSLKFPY
jgi:hypothetical protein